MIQSCTSRLVSVSGMYPTISCNHSMRARDGQFWAAVRAEKKAKKEKVIQLDMLHIMGRELGRFIAQVSFENREKAREKDGIDRCGNPVGVASAMNCLGDSLRKAMG